LDDSIELSQPFEKEQVFGDEKRLKSFSQLPVSECKLTRKSSFCEIEAAEKRMNVIVDQELFPLSS